MINVDVSDEQKNIYRVFQKVDVPISSSLIFEFSDY